MKRKGSYVLEAACGPGKHSLLLASQFLQLKGVLVSCDISGAMIKSLAKKYNSMENDYTEIEDNKYLIDEKIDYTELVGGTNNKLKN